MIGQLKRESSAKRNKHKKLKLVAPGERLARAAVDLMQQTSVSDLCLRSLVAAVDLTSAQAGYVLTPDPDDSGLLVTEAAYSPTGAFEFPERIFLQGSLTGKCFDTFRSLICRRSSHGADIAEFGSEVKSAVTVPLFGNRNTQELATHVLGAITLVSLTDEKAFSEEDRKLLEGLAAMVSVNMLNLKMEEFRRQTIVESLERISLYLEAKDPLTKGHSMRVAKVAQEIAVRLGLDAKMQDDIRTAAILMDIGNASIPDSVLKKPAGLTDEEYSIVRMHPLVSYEICEKLRLSPRVLQMVRNHHERLDGSGYPDRLRSSELPLGLRILCVADAFDAMKCRRPHREGLTDSEAMKQLSLDAGTKFDPGVVHTLREVLHSGHLNEVYEVAAA
ncbi:MAG: HD domain-containing protein [Fimbriimonadaceae bacterium]|jgi:putative nucleotidyltransferase with HDIG domain|nr:HD domain-containing protein [Fimbriimonadaceae bacterium]